MSLKCCLCWLLIVLFLLLFFLGGWWGLNSLFVLFRLFVVFVFVLFYFVFVFFFLYWFWQVYQSGTQCCHVTLYSPYKSESTIYIPVLEEHRLYNYKTFINSLWNAVVRNHIYNFCLNNHYRNWRLCRNLIKFKHLHNKRQVLHCMLWDVGNKTFGDVNFSFRLHVMFTCRYFGPTLYVMQTNISYLVHTTRFWNNLI